MHRNHNLTNTLQADLSVFYKFGINLKRLDKLNVLNEFKIVYILDDSHSMNTIENQNMSRWKELQDFMNLCLPLTTVFNTKGCDVYFLNNEHYTNVKTKQQLKKQFEILPSNDSSLKRMIQNVIKNHASDFKSLLIILVTDGEQIFTKEQDLIHFLNKKPNNVHLTIRLCTNDKRIIKSLNQLDCVKRLDIIYDYHKEQKKVKANNHAFNFAEYILKMLLGSIDPRFDKLDA